MKPFSQLNPTLRQRLEKHRQERDQWLAQTLQHLQADKRVSAAWLFGSLGRGDSDELSDIDLFVIVEDKAHEAVVRNRYEFMAQVDEPLLILEAPQNWPPGGVYNMALYPGSEGSHQVDWYWVRQSAAIVPSETILLFDRVGLPHKATPTLFDYAPVPERPITEVMSQEVNLFWVMLLIGAKYQARNKDGFWFRDIYEKITHFVNQPLPECITTPMPATRTGQLALMRQAADAMTDLMPWVAAQGCAVPLDFPPHAHRYLDLIEGIVDSMHS